MIQLSSIRTWDAGGAEPVAIVTGDALTYAVDALGMRNVIAAEATAGRHRTVGT